MELDSVSVLLSCKYITTQRLPPNLYPLFDVLTHNNNITDCCSAHIIFFSLFAAHHRGKLQPSRIQHHTSWR